MYWRPILKTLALCLLLCSVGHCHSFARKQLGGPPSEFERFDLPNPLTAALSDSTSISYVSLTSQENGFYATQRAIYVDSETEVRFFVATPMKNIQLSLHDVNGHEIALEKYRIQSSMPIGDSNKSVPNDIYQMMNITKGVYTLTLSSPSPLSHQEFMKIMSKSKLRNKDSHAMIVVWNDSPDNIFSHLGSYEHTLTQNDNIQIVCNLFDKSQSTHKKGERPSLNSIYKDSVQSAFMMIVEPDGTFEELPLHDDGLHGDLQANDGVFGGIVPAKETGFYNIQTVLKAIQSDGTQVVRTAEHLVQINSATTKLTGSIKMSLTSNLRLKATLGVSSSSTTGLRAYAQLWGHHLLSAQEVPIAWAASLVNVDNDQVSLEFDLDWLLKAKAVGPFTLKKVLLQDVNTMNPLSQLDISQPTQVNQASELKILQHVSQNITIKHITEKMRFGVRPTYLQTSNTSSTNSVGHLVMLHGYCSGGNPWQQNEHLFDNSVYFSDPEQSRSHDEFSNLVLDFIENKGLEKFSMIGHSQGGMVAMHIINYYWTGADTGSNGFAGQSLASPYGGSSGAGGAADILSMLGQGCGANYDLTRDGATLWSNGITSDAAAKQAYYTTQYKKEGPLGGGWCNMIVNTVLSKPNDGATESDHASLDGATFQGLTEGQCHVEGMKYMASFLDESRNKEMNSNAAR